MYVFGKRWLSVTIILFFNAVIEAQYVPPTPSVEPLYPRGLRMSIPDEDGISLVAYHVKFNEDFTSLEAGTIARDIIKTKNGQWTYEDRSTRLKRGDVIYYWVHVVYDGLGYNLLDKHKVVDEFYDYDGTPINQQTGGEVISCSRRPETQLFEDSTNPTQKQSKACPGDLIFEENFDALETSKWSIVERFTDVPSYEFVVYMNNDNNVNVRDGILHIKPVLTNDEYNRNDFVRNGNINLQRCTGKVDTTECKREGQGWGILPPVISGRLNTKNSFMFKYGRVQMRAKLPRGDWIYPLITLETVDRDTQNSSVYCDIILAHASGNPSLSTENGIDLSGRVLRGGAHALNIRPHKDNLLDLPNKNSNKLWSNDYHVYELLWKRGQVTLKVDGEQYGEQTLPALYENPMYINIGLAVGDLTTFPDHCISGDYEKPWKNGQGKAMLQFYNKKDKWYNTWTNSDTGLHVDYVKVWAI